MIISLDLSLITLVLLSNAVGYWLKKTKVNEWPVPLTLIIVILTTVVTTVWGWIISSSQGGWEMFSSFLTYGLPNGLWVGLSSVCLYDLIHGLGKKKETWLALLQLVKNFFTKKKEAKA